MNDATSGMEVSDAEAAERVADLLDGRCLAVAESCTGGLMAQTFASVEGASGWFRGGVVAYMSEVKYDVLGVSSRDVVREAAAIEMAAGVARLLDAQVALSSTGVAGPEPLDGKPAGTVMIGWMIDGEKGSRTLHLDGDPEEVIAQAASSAIRILEENLRLRSAGE